MGRPQCPLADVLRTSSGLLRVVWDLTSKATVGQKEGYGLSIMQHVPNVANTFPHDGSVS